MPSTAPYYHEPPSRIGNKSRSCRGAPKEPAQNMEPGAGTNYAPASNDPDALAEPVENDYTSQHNLSALLQAVATQNPMQQFNSSSQDNPLPSTRSRDGDSRLAEAAVSKLATETGKGKRKRSPRTNGQADAAKVADDALDPSLKGVNTSFSRKKQKIAAATPVDMSFESQEMSQGPREPSDDNSTYEGETEFLINQYPPQHPLEGMRASGIYSTAALFRKPSLSSKRYTRPPMNKLFASLDLAPENFLRLQSLAKAYMLDRSHPERQDCVGSRGKGDTDLVKLKLYNCVKDFLVQDNIGETYFGKDAEGAGTRKFVWPRDAEVVIAVVTPLLRRMLTNERQRQYAIESRKPGAQMRKGTPRRSMSAADVSMMEHLDPQLDSSMMTGIEAASQDNRGASTHAVTQLQIYIIGPDKQQLLSKTVCPAEHVEGLDALSAHVERRLKGELEHTEYGPSRDPRIRMKALLSDGLRTLQRTDDWAEALEEVKATVWLDNVLKIVVEVEGLK